MDQASRIVAQWCEKTGSGLIDTERIACVAWKKAVGPGIARHSAAVKLVRRELVVEVEDELWRDNLYRLKPAILRNMEEALGPGVVTDVWFRVMPGRIEPRRETRGLEPADIDAGLDIRDPGLRRIYRNARRRETA
jgi:hypothetical protein